ncbi:MAG: ABC transporter substrate-binding protein, partial [Candidatus Desantisbacteria bacterium]
MADADSKKKYPLRIGVLFISIALIAVVFWLIQRQPQKHPAPLEKVTIAHGSQPTAGLVYVAFAHGYFAEEGIDVTLQPHTSGKSALSAVIKGEA